MTTYKSFRNIKIRNGIVLMMFLLIGVFLGNVQQTHAASSVKVQSKAAAYADIRCVKEIEVVFPAKGDRIKNLKSNSNNLKILETSYESAGTYHKSGISYYAKKAGTYKITFDVYKADNQKRSSHSVTVYASKFQGFWKVNDKYYKKIPYGCTGSLNYYSTAYTGKITFVLPKGCKLLKLEKSYFTANGKEVTTKISNGAKTSFNRVSDSVTAFTNFKATYKDTYTNTISDMTLIVYCMAK